MADSSPSSTDGTDDAPPSTPEGESDSADGAATPDDVEALRHTIL